MVAGRKTGLFVDMVVRLKRSGFPPPNKMKEYPSIPHSAKAPREHCYVFVKYDGSGLRFSWSRKRGWHRFGTRRTLFDETHPVYGSAIHLFRQRYADALERTFTTSKFFRGTEEAVAYCEWFGRYSFAGEHKPDDPKALVLFDINLHKKGFVGPKHFLEELVHLEVAECLYVGDLTDDLIQDIRDGRFNVASKLDIRAEIPEGVVAKGREGHKLWRCKIKTQQYYDILRGRKPLDWQKFWE